MLKTYRAGALALAALMGVAASSAAAEQYEILMMENAFFPDVTFVQEGDTVTFVNMSGIPRTVEALDGTWETALLADGESFEMAIAGEMQPNFHTKLRGQNTADGSEVGNGTDGALTDDNVVTSTEPVDNAESEADAIMGSLDFTAPEALQN